MTDKKEILILGASYGSLLGSKLALAGHNVHLICLPDEADAINRDGVIVHMPLRDRAEPVVLDTKTASGKVSAGDPLSVDVERFDLVALAMQEPQYRHVEIRALMQRIARAGKPCMSIMNMPPLPYLKRIAGLDCNALRECYADASVWDDFDPALVTLCSPDPQAFRPPGEGFNVLQVTLPTNFKAARFENEEHTQVLRQLEQDILATTVELDGEQIPLPVKLRVHESIFVPMAKWSMLLTGNYRCIQRAQMISIREAVHADLSASRRIYDWVGLLCTSLGAEKGDLVPFAKYAMAAQGLLKPSSAARALDNGVAFIERVDLLVKNIALQQGLSDPSIDEIVATVEFRLGQNRMRQAS